MLRRPRIQLLHRVVQPLTAMPQFPPLIFTRLDTWWDIASDAIVSLFTFVVTRIYDIAMKPFRASKKPAQQGTMTNMSPEERLFTSFFVWDDSPTNELMGQGSLTADEARFTINGLCFWSEDPEGSKFDMSPVSHLSAEEKRVHFNAKFDKWLKIDPKKKHLLDSPGKFENARHSYFQKELQYLASKKSKAQSEGTDRAGHTEIKSPSSTPIKEKISSDFSTSAISTAVQTPKSGLASFLASPRRPKGAAISSLEAGDHGSESKGDSHSGLLANIREHIDNVSSGLAITIPASSPTSNHLPLLDNTVALPASQTGSPTTPTTASLPRESPSTDAVHALPNALVPTSSSPLSSPTKSIDIFDALASYRSHQESKIPTRFSQILDASSLGPSADANLDSRGESVTSSFSKGKGNLSFGSIGRAFNRKLGQEVGVLLKGFTSNAALASHDAIHEVPHEAKDTTPRQSFTTDKGSTSPGEGEATGGTERQTTTQSSDQSELGADAEKRRLARRVSSAYKTAADRKKAYDKYNKEVQEKIEECAEAEAKLDAGWKQPPEGSANVGSLDTGRKVQAEKVTALRMSRDQKKEHLDKLHESWKQACKDCDELHELWMKALEEHNALESDA